MERSMQRRIAGLTVALLFTVPLSVVAARWQWSRHLERDAMNAAVVASERTAPIAWQSLLRNGYSSDLRWRQVSAHGQWLDEQLLVRKQVVNGNVGFTVLTPFKTDGGVVLYVQRGWVDESTSKPPAILKSALTVTLRIQAASSSRGPQPSDLPDGQINWIDPHTLASASGWETVDAVFELVDPVDNGLVPLPWPQLTAGPHVSYTVQWVLIGITAVIVYIRVMWTEVVRRRPDEDE